MSERLANPLMSVEMAKENAIPAIPEIRGGENWSDKFWTSYEIDETRWDAVFPFQLILLKYEGGTYTRAAQGVFTLPIPPSAMQIATPFAIQGTVTQGGYIEEHNGAPIKYINAQGTTGVLPGRGSGKVLKSFNALQSIFAGTIRSAQSTLQAASNFAPPRPTNTVTDGELLQDLKGTTGYYQFLLLQKFLERYVFLKKTAAGSKYRLAFAIWKTQEIYLVTPQVFTCDRRADSTYEYNYQLQFKAWRRIKLDWSGQVPTQVKSIIREPGVLQSVLAKVETARRVLSGLKSTLQSVRLDVSTALFEPLRETTLFCKDALGVALTAADLPVNVVRDMKGAILEAASVSNSASQTGQAIRSVGGRVISEVQDLHTKLRELGRSSGKSETGAGVQKGSGVDSGNPDPANKALENPDDHFEFFSQVRPGELNLPPSVTRKMVEERERVRKRTRRDFEQMRDTLVSVLTDYEAAVGLGHERYTATYNRSTPTTTKVPSQDDYDAIFAMNDAIIEMNRLVAGAAPDQSRVTPIEYIAGLAGRSGINFKVPRSFLRVPFPYGSTLEMVAARYLGDAKRWHEIAALNRLREPYVDEEGFELPLLVNGSGNEVVVADATNLYVGQGIFLSSTTTTRTKRRITKIDRISDGYYVVRVDGDGDLDRFSTMGQATLSAFLPDTVNSQMLIAMPSDQPPLDEVFDGKSIPGLDDFDYMLQVGGVDLLLTMDGDAAITPDGDWRFAVGLTNLVQRVRLFVDTPRGSLLAHPTYGLHTMAGESTADFTAQELLSAVQDLFIFDPVFTGIRSAHVVKDGPVARMAVDLEVGGTESLIPINFEVRR